VCTLATFSPKPALQALICKFFFVTAYKGLLDFFQRRRRPGLPACNVLFPLELATVAIVQRCPVVLSCRSNRLAATVAATLSALFPHESGDSGDTSAVFFLQNLEKVVSECVELAFALHATLHGRFERTHSTAFISPIRERSVIAGFKDLFFLRSDALLRVEEGVFDGEAAKLGVHQVTQFLYGPVESFPCCSIREDAFQRGFRRGIFCERF